MKIYITSYYEKKHKKLTKKHPSLSKLIDNKIAIFKENPSNSALRLHKLSGKTIDEWSIWIKNNLRLVFQYVKDGILIIDIGSHKEVY